MTSKPITERLTALGQHAMGVDPQTWPQPDDVDVIQAETVYWQTDDFFDDVREWMTSDDDCVNYAADRFALTDVYERGFRVWLDRQIP